MLRRAGRRSDGGGKGADYYRSACPGAGRGSEPAPAPGSLPPGSRDTVCQDRPEEARAELTTTIHLYHVMEMTCWLPQPEAALAQIGG
jgi:hypothetical protein